MVWSRELLAGALPPARGFGTQMTMSKEDGKKIQRPEDAGIPATQAAWPLAERCALVDRVRQLEQVCAEQEALGHDQARLDGVLRAASHTSIISTDLDGIIQVFNTGAERMLGYSAREVVGKATPELFHLRAEVEAYARELEPRLGRVVSGFGAMVAPVRKGDALSFDSREWTYVRKDGCTVPVALTITGVYDESGALEGFLGVGLDRSAYKALEASLRQAQVSVDSAQDLVLWVRLDDRRIAYANLAACEALGYARHDLLGLDLQAVDPIRTDESWARACADLRTKRRSTAESMYRRKDGTAFPVEINVSLVVHEGQEHFVAIVRDISQRKAAEERLRFETHLNSSLANTTRALLNSALDMNAIAGVLLDSACALTGSRYGYVAFIDQETGGLQPRAMSAMMQSGECTLGALPVTFPMGPDGHYRGLWGHSLNSLEGFFENAPQGHPSSTGLPEGHVAIQQLLTMPAVSKGRLVGQIALANPGRDYAQADLETVAALADIFALGAEQTLSQRALVKAKEEAERSSHAKSAFLSNMTHEVRTPLNGILGMLQVLQTTALTGEQREYAGMAQQAAERLNLLLGKVIEYARHDCGTEGAECLLFPPTDLLHAMQALFAPKAAAKGLAFSVQAGPGLPEQVHSDPQALRQALTQLMDNALKFTPAGHVLLRADLTPDDPPRLVFRVEDTGIGIPEDMREQVFEAFVQADASITRTYGGTGLGLAIVRRLAQGMGGSIETQAREGGGTVMILTVPIDCAHPKTE